jgi:hypothetical protein
MMNDQYFDETEIMDKMQKGQPVEEILKYLYTQFKS